MQMPDIMNFAAFGCYEKTLRIVKTHMRKSDFNFNLPQELIAQSHAQPRDHSRLLVLHRQSGEIEDRHFYNLPEYLKAGDVLVVNNSKVLPARLFGQKPTGAHAEILLL